MKILIHIMVPQDSPFILAVFPDLFTGILIPTGKELEKPQLQKTEVALRFNVAQLPASNADWNQPTAPFVRRYIFHSTAGAGMPIDALWKT